MALPPDAATMKIGGPGLDLGQFYLGQHVEVELDGEPVRVIVTEIREDEDCVLATIVPPILL